MSVRRRKDHGDRGEYIVSDGISQGRHWFTCRRTPSGSRHRVVSPALPLRDTREEAEADLRRWLGEESKEQEGEDGKDGANEH